MDSKPESFLTYEAAGFLSRNSVVLIIVALLLALYPVRCYNSGIFCTINNQHCFVTDYLWLFLTTLGDGLLVGIILGTFLWTDPRITAAGLFTLLMSALFVHTIKHLLPELRPVMLIPEIHLLGPTLKYGSFPSGHTAAAFSAGIAIAYYTSDFRWKLIVLITAFLVGVSRIFVGAHFPADVIGGIIAALSAFFIYIKVFGRKIQTVLAENSDKTLRLIYAAKALNVTAVVIAGTLYAQFHAELTVASVFVAVAILLYIVAGQRLHTRMTR